MSLKDDFLEALNSVKRDFLKDEDTDPDINQQELTAAPDNLKPEAEIAPPPMPDDAVYGAFRQASVVEDSDTGFDVSDENYEDEDKEDELHTAPSDLPPPYRSYEPPISADEPGEYAGPPEVTEVSDFNGEGRKIYDFDRTDFYSDDKTVISRNTVIRGSLQTEDSVRLLGQVLGDIDCKSNIVVAGKVRGNTAAANAYIMDAQIDGSLTCDDVISISSDAWVLGNVRAQQAEVDGKIKGNLDIRHTISIGSKSSVIGNISTDELEIKRGAFVNGQIMMYTPSRDVIDRFDHFER